MKEYAPLALAPLPAGSRVVDRDPPARVSLDDAAFAVMTGLAVAATVAGYVVPTRRATGAGASRATVWLGAAGAVVGFFVVPIVGLPSTRSGER